MIDLLYFVSQIVQHVTYGLDVERPGRVYLADHHSDGRTRNQTQQLHRQWSFWT